MSHMPSHDTYGDTYGIGDVVERHMYRKSQASVSSPESQPYVSLSDDVRQTIRKHAHFDDPSRLWDTLFRLRRELDAIARDRAWDEDTWKAVAHCWASQCRGNGLDLPEFDEIWATLERKLKVTIKAAYGEMTARVRARMPRVVLPPELAENPRLGPLARALFALAEEHALVSRTVFRASLRFIAADLAGLSISPMTTLRRLGALSRLGYVSRPVAGTPGISVGGKPCEWVVHFPPIPGRVVWHTNETKPRKRAGRPADAVAEPAAPHESGPAGLDW